MRTRPETTPGRTTTATSSTWARPPGRLRGIPSWSRPGVGSGPTASSRSCPASAPGPAGAEGPDVDSPGRLRRGIGLALVLLLTLLSVSPQVEGPPASWASELVDGSTDVGEYNDLALNSTGVPHVAYRRAQPFPGAVMHAWKVGAAWSNETVFSDAGIVGRYISLAVDSADRLHVSFFANDVLYYATNASGPWVSVIVDDDPTAIVGWYSSFAVDSADRPRIAYYDQGNGRLKYAAYSGVSWAIDIVDSAPGDDAGRYGSLAIGPGDVPHIAYFYRTAAMVGLLKHAWNTGGPWNTENVTDVNYPGQYASLAVDGAGGLHVSHYRLTGRDLAYSYDDGTGWTTQVITTSGDVGLFTSIALDTGGQPHIAHFNRTANAIMRTWRESGTWYNETAVSPGLLANSGTLSLALTPTDPAPPSAGFPGGGPRHGGPADRRGPTRAAPRAGRLRDRGRALDRGADRGPRDLRGGEPGRRGAGPVPGERQGLLPPGRRRAGSSDPAP